MKKFPVLCTTLLMILMLCGCVANNKTQDVAVTEQKEESYNFICVFPILENEYWIDCAEGVEVAATNLGVNVSITGPKTVDNFAEEIVGYMSSSIKKMPDGIIIYGGIKELEPLIDVATDIGISVLTIDSDAPESKRAAYIGADEYNIGATAGEKVVSAIGNGKEVGILMSSESAEKEQKVISAFKDAVADYDIKVVDIRDGAEISTSKENTIKMLEEHPNISAIFCTSGTNGTGAGYAKEELKRDDLVIIGHDASEENIRLLKEGYINGLIVQNIKEAGYQSIYLLKQFIEDGSLPQTKYDSGSTYVNINNVDTYKINKGMITEEKKVKVGYYDSDYAFQSGYSDYVRKSGYAYEYYQKIAEIANWDYEYVYGNRSDIIHMLENGDVDIVAGVYKTDEMQRKILYSDEDMGIDGERRYFGVSKKRRDLLNELNYAAEKINNDTPDYLISLKQKYYKQVTEQILNEQETTWIKNKKEIKVGYVKGNLPFSDIQNGKPVGLVKELIEIIKTYTNLEVSSVCFDTLSAMEKAITDGDIDAGFPAYSDFWVNENNGLRQTETIVSDRIMIVYNLGEYSPDIMNNVAQTQENIGMEYFMKIEYPHSQVTMYSSRTEAMDAVLNTKDEMNCIIGSASILQRLIRGNSKYKNLNVAYLNDSEDFVMIVKEEENVLLGILDKTIKQIDSATINSAMVRYSGVDTVYTFTDILNQYAIHFIAVLLVIITIITLIFVKYRNQTNRFNIEQQKSHKALSEALEKANIASKAKTDFLSSMSHDIRTPLNAIVGMTNIAKMSTGDTDKVETCLEKIDLSSHHLLTLINNVLDISKIESGRIQLNTIVFSLKEAMDKMIDIVKPQMDEKNIEFEVYVDYIDNDYILADEVRINQIYMNIISNAIKYTPEGGRIVMELKETKLSEDSVRVLYSIKDNGIGMSEEFMRNMYKTFSRATDSRVNKIQGTGLGLAIVKQMVDMMDGKIDCISEENKGTKFTVTLEFPLKEREDVEVKEDLEYGIIEGESKPNSDDKDNKKGESSDKDKRASAIEKAAFLRDKCILVAEDNELNWEVISGIMGMYDVQTVRAENGRICVDMVKNSKPGTYDLILMDIQMPEMDGREATRVLRADENEYVRDIPIVAMTADAFAEDIEASRRAGMNGHVSKPVDIPELLQELKKVLRGGVKNKK